MRLPLFGGGVGVVEQRGPGPHGGRAVLQVNGAQGHAGVEVAADRQKAHGAGVPATGRFFHLLDGLHGYRFGRPGHRAGPKMGGEGVQGIVVGGQFPFHVIDRVHHPRVRFQQPAPDEAHAAGHADARHVVAVHVGTHGKLRFLLFGGNQRFDVCGRFHGRVPHRDGAGDGTGLHAAPVDPHEHLRRGTDQLLTAHVDQKAVRAGVVPAERAEQLGRRAAVGHGEDLGEHHLEEIPRPAPLPDALHLFLELSLRVVALNAAGQRARRRGKRRAFLAARAGRAERGLEIEGHAVCQLLAPVDHHQLGREEQAAVHLVGIAGMAPLQAFELEDQVVAERPVEAQITVIAAEMADQCPQQ